MPDSSQHHFRGLGRIFISCGEISGDRQAGFLARQIYRQNPEVLLYGCGGEAMRAAGVDVRIDTARFGYVGLQESIRFRRPMRKAHEEIQRILLEQRPDLVVLVDGEHFNRSLMPFLHREGIPFVYYFVPQVWFWGRWRTGGIARRARLIIPAFAPEADIFRRKGGRVEWFGHPFVDVIEPGSCESELREGEHPTIGLMPGSRWQEVENFTPRLLAAARELHRRRPELRFILPLAGPHLRPLIERELAGAGLSDIVELLERDVYDRLGRCELVLLASGTATLETTLLGVPMVVVYEVKPLTFFVARRLVSSRFIAMPNILLNEAVVPELIQSDFTVERVVAEAWRLLEDASHAGRMRQKLARVRTLLGRPGVIEGAATAILREAGLPGCPAPVEELLELSAV